MLVALKQRRKQRRSEASPHLNESPQRALRAPGCVCSKPWHAPPHHLAVATGNHLVAGHHKLHRPHPRRLLPQHEAPTLSPRSRWLMADHLHGPSCVHALHALFQASCCGQVLLNDVTSPARFLPWKRRIRQQTLVMTDLRLK